MAILAINGVKLPSPVSIKNGQQLIWSSNTERSSTGLMVGDVKAKKVTLDISWGIISDAEAEKIKNSMSSSFFAVSFPNFGGTTTITCYRGDIDSGECIKAGGKTFWRNPSVQLVQR